MTSIRIGHGYDLHRLKDGGTLRLGGVTVADNLSPVAHSDGDVVIHALVDAILGALGAGDIGEHFPSYDPQWKDADSMIFLRRAMEMCAAGGWCVINVDLTILAERPRLSPHKQAIAAAIRQATGAQVVNVKAGTNEGCDAIGEGKAIAAHVVVLLASTS